MILGREQILAQRLATERVRVPWINGGDEIIVQALPAHVLLRLGQIDQARENAHAFAFVHAVVDDNGRRIFKDDDATQVAATVDLALMRLVFEAAWRLSQPSPEKLETIKKNSILLATEDSGALPSPSDSPIPTFS